MPRALASVALALALAFALGACLAQPRELPPTSPSALTSRALPSFRRPTIGGDTFDSSRVRAQLVVVKFFAKYCEPCKRSLPALVALREAHPEVIIVGVSEDESEADARWMVEQYGLTFPVIHDRSNVLSGRFRVSELPVAFVADRHGIVRWVGGPEQPEGALRDAVEALSRAR
ncbi:MAG: TlpA disulfide reductase family protein [Sorangiineae bacterium]|nr:TlpA disulfide reductase family protein [Polyangiaceae bacterium]MEB2323288.1 TlpA disulfide reductase family protein [Sorangiineae bacterium]